MAFPQGISFRLTSGYVTDVSPATFEIGTSANYPRTTPQGNTVGWENAGTGIATRDRNSGNDARLAGIAFSSSNLTYRIDLPSSGNYLIRSACGDPNYTCGTQLSVRDSSTSLGSLSSSDTTAGNSFRDATDAQHTAGNWPGSNTGVTKTFSSTICRFDLVGDACRIAHLFTEAASTTLSRSAAVDATASILIAAQFFTILERSIAIGVTAELQAGSLFLSVLERTSAINGIAAIQLSGQHFTTIERSALVDAQAGITVAGQFFTSLSGSVAIDAQPAISVSGGRVVDRAVLLDVSATVQVDAQFFSVWVAIVGIGATAGLGISGHGVLERLAGVDGSSSIAVGAQFFSVWTRTSSLAGSATITAAHERELQRFTELGATAEITIRGEGLAEELERAVSLDTVASINASGRTVKERSASLELAASISTNGLFFTTFQRACQVDATVVLETSGLRTHNRSVLLASVAGISVNSQFYSLFDRSAGIVSEGAVAVSGVAISVVEHERLSAFSVTGNISTTGYVAVVILHPTSISLVSNGQSSAIMTSGTNDLTFNSGETGIVLDG